MSTSRSLPAVCFACSVLAVAPVLAADGGQLAKVSFYSRRMRTIGSSS
jgi:hypothetical protein